MQDDFDTLRDFLAQGGTLQALVDIDPADLDKLYAYACQLFDAGDYEAAKRFYLMLARLSHWQFDYWLALGLACQRLNEHEEALFSFGQAGLLRLDDPRPPYLSALSYQLTNRSEHAQKAFTAASRCCGSKPEYAAFKAELLREKATLSAQEI
ncbi:SycD/LcrH family type III secretion system chaperone [Chitinimonas sp. BJB300]|uniref:SycD/LcrH family type III secretion system chaperone n=1 Tax=Chitinimonas sp. BJB300 TaxID=1559339 RepID=UPI000C0D8EBC|nr:SycD/LcrH family type III secretion system chaperone [Chitinimonas sp. BJB300]PHV11476.1 CesD/SycD/LcrH family type III secretion system chaperone [Chitinimonas sp. BJB300]TSJ88527.1 CesD/SycD/LcrH family type III secretion system chaperone [Chitinimonas sp. BJB300]